MVVPISHCLWDLNLSSGTSGPGRLPSVLLEFWCFVSHRCPRSALPLPFLSGHKNPLRSPPPALRSRGVSVPLPILCPPSLGPPVSARTGCELVSLLMSSVPVRVAYSPDRALLQGKDRDAVLVIPLHARSVQSTPGEPNKCILLERTRYHRRVGPAQSETTKIVGIRVRQMGSRRSNPASTYWLMVSCLNLSFLTGKETLPTSQGC